MTNKVTLTTVLQKGREYLDAGKLGAQQGYTQCKYDYGDGCRCIVGAALSDELLINLVESECNTSKIISLHEGGTVELIEEELNDICDLQYAHDSWCMATDKSHREELKQEFIELFESLENHNKEWIND